MTEEIDYEDFAKLDLRIARIKKVEDIENADKLYKLTIDVGELGERIICAGIKQNYSKDDLKDKEIVIIANLKARELKGIKSQGMLLAAVDDKEVVLLNPEKSVKEGIKVS